MKLLLDTHIFLWFVSGDKRLSSQLQAAICSPQNEAYLSVVSIWEAIVKHQLGKLRLPEPPQVYLPKQRQRHFIQSLALDEASTGRLTDLPPLHRDLFDRMLVCQALQHGLTIVTVDDLVRAYPVAVVQDR